MNWQGSVVFCPTPEASHGIPLAETICWAMIGGFYGLVTTVRKSIQRD